MKPIGRFIGAIALTAAAAWSAYLGAQIGLKPDTLAVALGVLTALCAFAFQRKSVNSRDRPAWISNCEKRLGRQWAHFCRRRKE